METYPSESRVDKFNEQLNLIKNGLTKSVKQHKEMGVRACKLRDNIEATIKHEPYTELQIALRALQSSLAEIEREREKAITTRMQVSVIGKLNSMEQITKKPINLVATSFKKKRKKLQKETNKTTINETAVQDARAAVKTAEKEFFTQLPPFEQARVEDIKMLLEEYCNSLMYYHCKSIEQLSSAMSALGKVDGKAARKQCEKSVDKNLFLL
jgi:hypothetical protein